MDQLSESEVRNGRENNLQGSRLRTLASGAQGASNESGPTMEQSATLTPGTPTQVVEYTEDFEEDSETCESGSGSDESDGETQSAEAGQEEEKPPRPPGTPVPWKSHSLTVLPVSSVSKIPVKVHSHGDCAHSHEVVRESLAEGTKQCVAQQPGECGDGDGGGGNEVDEVEDEITESGTEGQASWTMQVHRFGQPAQLHATHAHATTHKFRSSCSKHQLLVARKSKMVGLNHAHAQHARMPLQALPRPVGFVQKRVSSAKRIQVKDLTSRIRYLEGIVEDLKHENRTLKTIHLRQDAALKKYEGAESDLTAVLTKHKNEVHYLQSNLRKAYGSCRDSDDQIRTMTQKINRLEHENHALQELVKSQDLGERHALTEQLKTMGQHTEALETRLLEYERHIEVLQKNHTHQIEVEQGKIRSLNKKVFDARKEVEAVTEAGHQKDRIINYLRMRCGRENELEAPMVKKMYEQMHNEEVLRNPETPGDLNSESCSNFEQEPEQNCLSIRFRSRSQTPAPRVRDSRKQYGRAGQHLQQDPRGRQCHQQKQVTETGHGHAQANEAKPPPPEKQAQPPVAVKYRTPRSYRRETTRPALHSQQGAIGENQKGHPKNIQQESASGQIGQSEDEALDQNIAEALGVGISEEQPPNDLQQPNSGRLSLDSLSLGSSARSLYLGALDSSCNVSSVSGGSGRGAGADSGRKCKKQYTDAQDAYAQSGNSTPTNSWPWEGGAGDGNSSAFSFSPYKPSSDSGSERKSQVKSGENDIVPDHPGKGEDEGDNSHADKLSHLFDNFKFFDDETPGGTATDTNEVNVGVEDIDSELAAFRFQFQPRAVPKSKEDAVSTKSVKVHSASKLKPKPPSTKATTKPPVKVAPPLNLCRKPSHTNLTSHLKAGVGGVGGVWK